MEDIRKLALRNVIEETDWAYRSVLQHEYMNSDYADFAGMALGQFKDALCDPDLTREELEKMLRKGMSRHRKSAPDSCWTTFMAGYVAQASNGNRTHEKR